MWIPNREWSWKWRAYVLWLYKIERYPRPGRVRGDATSESCQPVSVQEGHWHVPIQSMLHNLVFIFYFRSFKYFNSFCWFSSIPFLVLMKTILLSTHFRYFQSENLIFILVLLINLKFDSFILVLFISLKFDPFIFVLSLA